VSAARDADVLIVGGGLVGSALANALVRIPLRVALIEARDPTRLEQPGFDNRATALANGSRRILEQLGISAALQGETQPITMIHIGQRGGFGAARIEASEEGVDALGHTLENRVLGRALWSGLEGASGFECIAPARLVRLEPGSDAVAAEIECGGGSRTITAQLLVAADGAHSSVRGFLGVPARRDDYGQRAVIVNCETEIAHGGRAFERFTSDGPLAVLPLTRGRVAVVWTLADPAAERALALPDPDFRFALERAFGRRLGRIRRVGARAAYALGRLRSEAEPRARAVLIGDAATRLHPVAGQGFNLALRDVAALAEVVADEVASGGACDVGRPAVLARYADWRRSDRAKAAWFTHGLVRLFGARWPGLGIARGLGLVAFDLVPGAKSLLARHTMGMAGRLPRLARGLDLS
jgi:2-octaprenyl-6-methoxyphenol hydroxylase